MTMSCSAGDMQVRDKGLLIFSYLGLRVTRQKRDLTSCMSLKEKDEKILHAAEMRMCGVTRIDR